MQIQVTGHKVDVTPALREHVETRVERAAKAFDKLTSIAVVLTIDKLEHRAEGTLTGPGVNLHAIATAADMYTSIDVLIDKLVLQLRKQRDKQHANRNPAKVREARYG